MSILVVWILFYFFVCLFLVDGKKETKCKLQIAFWLVLAHEAFFFTYIKQICLIIVLKTFLKRETLFFYLYFSPNFADLLKLHGLRL